MSHERLDPVDHETNYVQIEIEGGAYIVVELYPDIAPITATDSNDKPLNDIVIKTMDFVEIPG